MAIIVQVACTGIISFLFVTLGLIYVWPSSTFDMFSSKNTTLNRPMTETEQALFGSLSSIGGLISTPIAGYYMDSVGRKKLSIINGLMMVVAWTLIATFDRVEVVLAAVFLSGLGGAIFLFVPVYVCEFCQESIRGTMTSCTMLFLSVGTLLSYLLGGYVEYSMTIYICLTCSIVGVALLTLMKESPVLLMKKGLEKEAAEALAFYRSVKVNSKEVLEEMNVIRRSLDPDLDECPDDEPLNSLQKSVKKLTTWQFIKKSQSTRKEIFLTCGLCILSIFQGLVCVQMFAMPLFADAVSSLPSTVCSIFIAVVMVVAGIVVAFLMDFLGRRPLMIMASIAAGICCVALGSQIQLHWGPPVLTAVLIYAFCAATTFGGGTVPYVVLAEVFLPEVRSLMTMLTVELTWLSNFLVLLIFNPLIHLIGLGSVFYVFAAVCFSTALFSHVYLPETKGLSVDAIQDLFSTRRKSLAINY